MRAHRVIQLKRTRRRLETAARQQDLAPLRPFMVMAFSLLAVASLAGAVALFAFVRPLVDYGLGIQPPTEVVDKLSRGGAKIYDRNGSLLYQFVSPIEGLRQPVALDHISPWMIEATIAVEDPSFFENPGINVRGLARAAYENFAPVESGELFAGSGGSSITQQLAKNIYIPFEERAARTVDRKTREVAIALELTRRYPKEQILEWYLNSISYGGIYVGVDAAAQGYFGKPASELTLGEAALLAGLPQAPTRYDPARHLDAAIARRHEVLRLMVEHGAITSELAAQAAAEPVVLREQRFELRAPHFVLGPVADDLKRRFGEDALYHDGLIVTTTLDLGVHRLAERALEDNIAKHEERTNSRNGALVAIDPKTGQVLAYVGSRDYYDDSLLGRNDNIVALNSPGSTLKPFTYMTAFMEGWGTGTGIPDMPFTYHDIGSNTDFKPTNPGKRYMGIAPAAKALGNSLNVPALHAILYGGVDSTVETLTRAGYTTFRDASQYGPALTLGGTDIKLLESVLGYSVIANGGILRGQQSLVPRPDGQRQIDPVVVLQVTDGEGRVRYQFDRPAEERVLPEGATALVTAILSDGQNTCFTWQCGALQLRNGMPAVVKTGTSEPFVDEHTLAADTWTLGFTTELLAGVWAGNADNEPVHDIFSTTIAWNAWHDFMVGAHEILDLEGKAFERPSSVVERVVCSPSGYVATSTCPKDHRFTALFMANVDPAIDTWWRRTADGRLVLALPAIYRQGRTRLVSNTPNLAEIYRSGGSSVVSGTGSPGVGDAGSHSGAESGSGAAPVLGGASIAAPLSGQTVSGVIAIAGIARSDSFVGYYLDVVGPPSQSLGMSAQPGAGALAQWDTHAVPNGVYTVRLVVQDGKRGTLIDTARVTVQN